MPGARAFTPSDSFSITIRLSTIETLRRLSRILHHVSDAVCCSSPLPRLPHINHHIAAIDPKCFLRIILMRFRRCVTDAHSDLLYSWLDGEEREYLAPGVLAVEAVWAELRELEALVASAVAHANDQTLGEGEVRVLRLKVYFLGRDMERAIAEVEEMRICLASEVVEGRNADTGSKGKHGEWKRKRIGLLLGKLLSVVNGETALQGETKEKMSLYAKRQELLGRWREWRVGTPEDMFYL